ncbi:MAG: rRNA maturation RNase YbeY [Candidatus Aminicenantes bacterium]|nr:rRNA maturation RNase YbeY [Candidatus Aminicenantes bacterium]
MIFILNRQSRHKIRIGNLKRLLERLIRTRRLGEVEVCLSFVGTDRIRSLNRRFRRKDEPTDVLSFPLSSRQADGRLHLGDIVIAPEQARRNCRSLGHGLERELEILTVHGFLHLLGYDHSARMERAERRALERPRRAAGR